MENGKKKLYIATTVDGKIVRGTIGYQQTFWGYEDKVIIDSRGKCFNVVPNTIKEIK